MFSKVKEFFKRYDFNTVTGITGATEEEIKLVADTMVKNKPGTILYALGMTQHTVGVQNIRSFGVLQLLLGNVANPAAALTPCAAGRMCRVLRIWPVCLAICRAIIAPES